MIQEWSGVPGESSCVLCQSLTRLAKVIDAGDHIWKWAECCPKCKVVVQKIVCPTVPTGDQSPVGVAKWLVHLREHGWRDSDFDPLWLARAKKGAAS